MWVGREKDVGLLGLCDSMVEWRRTSTQDEYPQVLSEIVQGLVGRKKVVRETGRKVYLSYQQIKGDKV